MTERSYTNEGRPGSGGLEGWPRAVTSLLCIDELRATHSLTMPSHLLCYTDFAALPPCTLSLMRYYGTTNGITRINLWLFHFTARVEHGF